MGHSRSLRFRISLTFLLLGGLISALFAVAVGVVTEMMERGYIEASLNENLDLVESERRRDPGASLPFTRDTRAYVARPGEEQGLPAYLRGREPGLYEVDHQGREYEFVVRDTEGGQRYYMVYDATALERARDRLYVLLAAGVALCAGLALWLSFRTSDRIIAPVTSLARRIRSLHPDSGGAREAADYGDDEVGELARTFDEYARRLHEFVEREKEFTANASHELRTPLLVISSTTELLLAEPGLAADTRERLARIQRATGEMVALVDAFLMLARDPERGPAEPGEALAVEPLLRRSLEARRAAAEGRGLALRLEVLGDPRVAAPAAVLSMVIDNILANAITHTERGGIEVRLEAQGLSVADTGRGVPAAEQAHVFRRHFRGRGAPPGGAGLGLAIVKRLCDRYGWRVDLESRAGEGTCVHVRFAL